MTFKLAEMQKEDCVECATLDEAAGANWGLARAMEQGVASRKAMFEEWFYGYWGRDPSLKWMKVVDNESGEIAAWALWQFVLDPAIMKLEEEHAQERQRMATNAIPPVFIEMGRRWREFHAEFVGEQPFASQYTLNSSAGNR